MYFRSMTSVRQRVKQHTKAQFAAMTKTEVDKHVANVLKEAKTADTKDLTYLYKALPGDRKTPEMKSKLLPFEFSKYKKTLPRSKTNPKK